MALTNKEKRHALKIGRKWLKIKMRLEGTFERDVRSYFAEQYKRVRSGRQSVSISPVLARHYDRVVKAVRLGATKQEEESFGLQEAIAAFLLGRGDDQAQIINAKTRSNITQAINIARQELADMGIAVPGPGVLERVSSRVFRNINNGRVGNIVTTETQMAVEAIREEYERSASRMMEEAIERGDKALAERAAERSDGLKLGEIVDRFDTASAAALTEMRNRQEKTWVTMGDRRVRSWHEAANFQTVPVNEPFIVDGERLMHPGDTSLGASVRNIARCRCIDVWL